MIVPTEAPARPQILVVEDEPAIRQLFVEFLEDAGFTVAEASDGIEGLAAFAATPPSLVLVDAAMPRMDGVTMCRRLRELPEGRDVPLLMVTAHSDARSVDEAFDAGVTDFIPKPVHLRVLELRLRHLLATREATAALHASEARYRTLVETSPDAIALTRLDGTLLLANSRAATLYGYAGPEEMVGLSGFALYAPEEHARAAATLTQVLEVGSLRNLELTGLRRDGTPVPIEASVSVIRDDRGQPAALMAIARDITERRLAQEALQQAYGALEERVRQRTAELDEANARLRAEIQKRRAIEEHVLQLAAIVESTDDAIVGKALDGRITSWNAGAERLYGYAAEEVIGRPFSVLVPPERAGEVDQVIGHITRGERLEHYETVRMRNDGRRIDVSMTDSPLRDSAGRIAGISSIARDITERKRAEAALVEQAELLELAHDAIIVRDLAGTITFWNHGAELMYGWPKAEALGQRSHALLRTHAPRPFPELEAELLGTGRWEGELDHTTRDGSAIVVASRWALKRDARGEPSAVLEINDDITARKHAELALLEREATLQAVITASPDIITILEPDGCIRWNSPSIRTLLGYVPETQPGRPALKLVHPDDQERLGALFQLLLSGARDDVQTRFRYAHADGRWVVLEAHGQCMAGDGGEAVGVVVVSRDVTEQTRIEERLREAKEEAEAANRAKSEFLSRMSHELRTPLNAILGFAQVLEMGTLVPEDRESVEQILRGGRHLLALINEVLDIARIDAGRLTLSIEPVALREVIPEVVALIAPLADARDIQVAGDMPAEWWVLADQQRLKQVLLNLLANAVKYNRAGGSVRLVCAAPAQGAVRIEVRDTGPGIAAEDLPRLFTPFERLGAEGSGVEGTGIGLALSRRLMEAMGGAIGVESVLGAGSTFWIELPAVEGVARVEQPGPEREGVSRATGPSRRVLYVEDNLSNLRLIEQILRHRPGVHLLAAMRGGLGLELAQEHQPDLILLDLHLPDIMGDEVLHRLQEEPTTRDIPVVMISADATPRQIERLLAAGARGYLTKPLDVREFLTLIDEALATGRT